MIDMQFHYVVDQVLIGALQDNVILLYDSTHTVYLRSYSVVWLQRFTPKNIRSQLVINLINLINLLLMKNGAEDLVHNII